MDQSEDLDLENKEEADSIKRKGNVQTQNNMENTGPKKFEKKQVSHKKAGGSDMSNILIIIVILFLFFKIYKN